MSLIDIIPSINHDLINLSYSTLATFQREGPAYLRDKNKTNLLQFRFGSLVDCMLSESDKVSERFEIASFSQPSAKVCNALEYIWNLLEDKETDLSRVDDNIIITAAKKYDCYPKYADSTILTKFRSSKCKEYYRLLSISAEKLLVERDVFERAEMCVHTLKNNPFTSYYFDDTEDSRYEKYYQLRVYFSIPVKVDEIIMENVGFVGIIDRLIVDHESHTIEIIDLKTTTKELEFEDSVWSWGYYIQAEMYRDAIKHIISQDQRYCNYQVLPVKFVCINQFTQAPLVWKYNLDSDNKIFKKLGYKHYIELAKEALFHIRNNKYTYPFTIYKNDGECEIKFPNVERRIAEKKFELLSK